jgi:hypothetical protein
MASASAPLSFSKYLCRPADSFTALDGESAEELAEDAVEIPAMRQASTSSDAPLSGAPLML